DIRANKTVYGRNDQADHRPGRREPQSVAKEARADRIATPPVVPAAMVTNRVGIVAAREHMVAAAPGWLSPPRWIGRVMRARSHAPCATPSSTCSHFRSPFSWVYYGQHRVYRVSHSSCDHNYGPLSLHYVHNRGGEQQHPHANLSERQLVIPSRFIL